MRNCRMSLVGAMYLALTVPAFAADPPADAIWRGGPIVTFDDLTQPPFAGFRWGIRQSGVRVPGPLAEALDALWQSRCAAAVAAASPKPARHRR